MKKKIISLCLVISTILSMLITGAAAAESELPFIDVPTSKWFYTAISSLYEKGLMIGKTDNLFAPDASMTRAEFVTLIARLSGEDTKGCESELEKFTDAKNSWYSADLGWAVKVGLVNGYDDKTVRPNNPILRQEFAKLISTYLDYSNVKLEEDSAIESFTDKDDIPGWAADHIELLRITGLSAGDEKGQFLPAKTATRAEVAELTNRLIAKIDDAKLIAQYDALLPADGTEYTYEGELTEDNVNSWIYNKAVTGASHKSASVQDFETLLKEYNNLGEGESKKVDVTFNFEVSEHDIINTKIYLITISKESAEDPNDALAADGTTYTYSSKNMTVKALNEWILKNAAKDAAHDKAEIKNFSEIIAAYKAIEAGSQSEIDVKVEFAITANGVSCERTYKVTFNKPAADPTDPNPDNIGVAYDEESGLKISNVVEIKDENGSIDSCATGIHGNYETRVVRTENGVYAVYLTYENENPPADHPLWVFGEVEFSIVKITSNGSKVLYKDRYPRALGSCAPNILNGEDGKVYVTIIADDKDKYMSSGYTREGAYLAVYELDTAKDEVTSVNKATPDFDTTPQESHGYGYSQPILDLAQGKLYAVYNGGGRPGYIAWFIYDLKTGEWDTTCRTVQIDYRNAYINGYADGKGGFKLVIERCALGGDLSEGLGVEFTSNPESYIWDALYIYHIEDADKAEINKKVIIREPEYSKTEANTPQSMKHYGNAGGCTYLDNDGNIHVIYTNRVKKALNTYHAIYDSNLNEIKNEPITFSKDYGTSRNDYSFGMTQGLDGTYYILAAETYSTTARLEVWSSEDGKEFSRIFDFKELVTKEPQNLQSESSESYTVPTGPITIGNTRNNSVNDGTVSILLTLMGKQKYMYFSVELP